MSESSKTRKFARSGQFIKNRRQALRVSRLEMMKALGYDNVRNIEGIERGYLGIPKNKIKPLAKILNLPVGAIIDVMAEIYKESLR